MTPITEGGWLLAMSQSSQPWGMEGRYVWGEWEVTCHQLENYRDLLSQQTEFDTSRIVTAGISKRGEVAVWMAMSGRVPAQGFVAVAPGGPRIEEPQKSLHWVEGSRDREIRGYLIVGDQSGATSRKPPGVAFASRL